MWTENAGGQSPRALSNHNQTQSIVSHDLLLGCMLHLLNNHSTEEWQEGCVFVWYYKILDLFVVKGCNIKL